MICLVMARRRSRWRWAGHLQRNTGVAVNLPVMNQALNTTRTRGMRTGITSPTAISSTLRSMASAVHGAISISGRSLAGAPASPATREKASTWRTTTGRARLPFSANCGRTRDSRSRTSALGYGAFQALDNQLVTPADYDPFCITAPVDSRLPSSVSGKQFCDNYDIKPAKFGLVDNLRTQASHYGKQVEIFNGIDFTFNTRFRAGGTLRGEPDDGESLTDNCLLIDSPSTVVAGSPAGAQLALPTQDARPGFCRVSTRMVVRWDGGRFQRRLSASLEKSKPARSSRTSQGSRSGRAMWRRTRKSGRRSAGTSRRAPARRLLRVIRPRRSI